MKFKKYYTDTDSLTSFPALIQASGEPLIDYTIYGNTGGVGELWENVLINNFTDKTPQEANGLTVTVNGMNITVDGTATRNTNLVLYTGEIHSLQTSDYQIFENAIYTIGGNPQGAEDGKYIITCRYDDAVGGTPSQTLRFPSYGETIDIDNSTGAYKYICTYIAVWSGQTVPNVTFSPFIRKKGYKIPVNSGGVTTNLPVDSPLGLTDTLTYTQTGIAIPTFDGDNTISFGTTVQPSGMSAEFKGWHSQDTVRVYNGNTWD